MKTTTLIFFFCLASFSISAQNNGNLRIKLAKQYLEANPSDMTGEDILANYQMLVTEFNSTDYKKSPSERELMEEEKRKMDAHFFTVSPKYRDKVSMKMAQRQNANNPRRSKNLRNRNRKN